MDPNFDDYSPFSSSPSSSSPTLFGSPARSPSINSLVTEEGGSIFLSSFNNSFTSRADSSELSIVSASSDSESSEEQFLGPNPEPKYFSDCMVSDYDSYEEYFVSRKPGAKYLTESMIFKLSPEQCKKRRNLRPCHVVFNSYYKSIDEGAPGCIFKKCCSRMCCLNFPFAGNQTEYAIQMHGPSNTVPVGAVRDDFEFPLPENVMSQGEDVFQFEEVDLEDVHSVLNHDMHNPKYPKKKSGADAEDANPPGPSAANANDLPNCSRDNSESEAQLNMLEPKEILINKIENLIFSLLEDLVGDNELVIRIRKTTVSNCNVTNQKLTMKSGESSELTDVKYTCKSSKNKFSVMLHTLADIHRLLRTGTTTTKRELYYNNPGLFDNQEYLNDILNDISILLEAKENELGIVSRSKGLIVGDLKYTTADGEIVDCQCEFGLLIPSNVAEIKNLSSSAKFILVVEKDTVFKSLLQQKIFEKLEKKMLMITGKGYPDLTTRAMLCKLANMFRIPIYAVMDCDPYGIEIMMIYKYGSIAMSHISDELAVPSLHWLGILPSDIHLFKIPTMELTEKDTAKLNSILKREYISESIKNELLIMRQRKTKAEIEGIGGLTITSLLEYMQKKYVHNLIV